VGLLFIAQITHSPRIARLSLLVPRLPRTNLPKDWAALLH